MMDSTENQRVERTASWEYKGIEFLAKSNPSKYKIEVRELASPYKIVQLKEKKTGQELSNKIIVNEKTFEYNFVIDKE